MLSFQCLCRRKIELPVALILLLARQIDARGSDLLSVVLGRHAWALLGKPTQRLRAPAAVVTAAP